MPNFKEFIVVLGIAIVAFGFLKPFALQFTAESDFTRRRNLWLVLTCLGFLVPNIWLYILVAGPLLLVAGRKDSNPIALYLVLLHVIPPVTVPIPFPGINTLFDISNYRVLALFVLVPAFWRLRADKSAKEERSLQAMDLLLLAFGVLHTVLYVRPDIPNAYLLHDSTTNLLRRLFLFLLDIYVLYYVVSRSCTKQTRIVDAMAAFCVVSCVMSLEAVFETLRHWLLYLGMGQRLSPDDTGMRLAYLLRGGVLRAQVSSGHPLALGYLLAVAFGFWLYLQRQIDSKAKKAAIVVVLWAGLFAAYSRGPWLGAATIYFLTLVLNSKALGRLARAAVVVGILAGVISLTPLGHRIAAVLPFMGGTVDAGNLDYRTRLASVSWNLVMNHPFFGDQEYITKMQDLRQGQGIIDVVNAYAGVALQYGLVGLTLFVGFIVLAVIKAYKAMREAARRDRDLSLLGICIIACIAGTMLMIYAASFMFGFEMMFYVLAGFAAAYASLSEVQPELTATKKTRPQRFDGGVRQPAQP